MAFICAFKAQPAQIPACKGFPAPGSCRRSPERDRKLRGVDGLCSSDPQAHSFCGHAEPGPVSGACGAAHLPFDRPPSLHHLRRRREPALFEASQVLCSRPTFAFFLGGFVSSTSRRDPCTAAAAAGEVRSPRFRRDLFQRDGVLDHGRVAGASPGPALFMLPLIPRTASAPAITHFRGSLAHPTRLPCTLRRRCTAIAIATLHSPGGALPLTLAGLAPAGSREVSPGAPEGRVDQRPPAVVARDR